MSQRYYEAVGRRKCATARVRLYPASAESEFVVNGKSMPEFFTRLMDQSQIMEPLRTVEMEQRFNISVMVEGGGVTGQAGAVRQALARALTEFDENLRPPL